MTRSQSGDEHADRPRQGMTKTEAADILATYISVRVRQRDLDDVDLAQDGAGHTLIAECISEARHKPEGTYLNVAGGVRPSDRTIRTAYRRNAGLI